MCMAKSCESETGERKRIIIIIFSLYTYGILALTKKRTTKRTNERAKCKQKVCSNKMQTHKFARRRYKRNDCLKSEIRSLSWCWSEVCGAVEGGCYCGEHHHVKESIEILVFFLLTFFRVCKCRWKNAVPFKVLRFSQVDAASQQCDACVARGHWQCTTYGAYTQLDHAHCSTRANLNFQVCHCSFAGTRFPAAAVADYFSFLLLFSLPQFSQRCELLIGECQEHQMVAHLSIWCTKKKEKRFKNKIMENGSQQQQRRHRRRQTNLWAF